MMFADDVAISNDEAGGREFGKVYVLERRGMKVSRSRTESTSGNERYRLTVKLLGCTEGERVRRCYIHTYGGFNKKSGGILGSYYIHIGFCH